MQDNAVPQGLFAARRKFPLLQKQRQVNYGAQHSEDDKTLPTEVWSPKDRKLEL